MLLDVKQIEHLAHLARLELTDQQKKKFVSQLSSVLDYFEKLKQIKTDGVEPTSQSIPLNNIYRVDEFEDRDQESRHKILNNAPARRGDYFKVNKIL